MVSRDIFQSQCFTSNFHQNKKVLKSGQTHVRIIFQLFSTFKFSRILLLNIDIKFTDFRYYKLSSIRFCIQYSVIISIWNHVHVSKFESAWLIRLWYSNKSFMFVNEERGLFNSLIYLHYFSLQPLIPLVCSLQIHIYMWTAFRTSHVQNIQSVCHQLFK